VGPKKELTEKSATLEPNVKYTNIRNANGNGKWQWQWQWKWKRPPGCICQPNQV